MNDLRAGLYRNVGLERDRLKEIAGFDLVFA